MGKIYIFKNTIFRPPGNRFWEEFGGLVNGVM